MRILRAALIAGFALGLLTAPLAAEAQQAATVPRISFLAFNRGVVPACQRPSVMDYVTSVTSRAAAELVRFK
jgi:hypothetical protein